MLSQTYIALLTALSSYWVLMSQLGDYLQATREDKRVLRPVLLNQLDLRVRNNNGEDYLLFSAVGGCNVVGAFYHTGGLRCGSRARTKREDNQANYSEHSGNLF